MDIFDTLVDNSAISIEKQPWMNECKFILVDTEEKLRECVEACIQSGLYALDLETTGLDVRVIDGETVDKIVGFCLSPDGFTGYYIPIRHYKISRTGSKELYKCNLPWSLVYKYMTQLVDSEAVAIFHNAKFDTEFLQFNRKDQPIGEWDDLHKFEDTLILAYLENSRRKFKGLKYLSQEYCGIKQLELSDIFPPKHEGSKDFSQLNPHNEEVLWYAGGDAIATFRLFHKLHPLVVGEKAKPNQAGVYKIEKLCLPATRWMERNRIPINVSKVEELIELGFTELLDAVKTVYEEVEGILGRNIQPSFVKYLLDPESRYYLNPKEPLPDLKERLDKARTYAKRNKQVNTATAPRRARCLVTGIEKTFEFPLEYDIFSPEQLGKLFWEMGVSGLSVTEKSGQVATSKKEIDNILDTQSETFPFLGKVQRFREIGKALSTYLHPILQGVDPKDGTVQVGFNAHKVETGRFATKVDRLRSTLVGWPAWNLQATPSYDSKRPECMSRIREVVEAPEGWFVVSIDYSGVELRIVTNMSQEPRWLEQFFKCSDCNFEIDKEDTTPYIFCPSCGSDKLGDIHTLTASSIFDGYWDLDEKERKELRKKAKALNFALCYGGSWKAVERTIGCSKQESMRIKDIFDKAFKVLSKWWDKKHAQGRKYGYVLNAFGRKYPVPDINLPRVDKETGRSNGMFISKAERNCTNGPVQSTSADITKLAMGLIYRELKKRGWEHLVRMIITMHDELDFIIHHSILEEAIDLIENIMTKNDVVMSLKWKVGLTTDTEVGRNWMIPWNVTQARHTGEWVDELKPLFKSASKPQEDSSVEVEEIIQIEIEELTKEYAMKLSNAISLARDPKGVLLKLKGFEDMEDLRVNKVMFNRLIQT